MSSSTVTLVTDFGSRDGYVGAMKGVILGINPAASVVDITHDVSAQDIGHAAFVLGTTCPYFPPDTVHVAVVDPGVGTSRQLPGGDVEVDVGGASIAGLRRSYADGKGLRVLVGSHGFLEIAEKNGSAATRLSAAVGTRVMVRPG